jgi:hypothetical protein
MAPRPPRPPRSLPDGPDGLRIDEALDGLERRGFRAHQQPAPGGLVGCDRCGAMAEPSDVMVLAQARVEGVSDPADETFLAGVRCPSCHALGTLVLAYGPRARRDEAQVLAGLPALRRLP